MKQPAPKMSALVVSAIRNLREARGSTSKDIMNYIMTEHHSGDAAIQRQMNAALKRGVDYGIFKRVNGHYSLNGDPYCLNPQNMVPEDKGRRKRRSGRARRRGGRKRGRRGRGRHRARKAPMKSRRRNLMNRKRGIHVRRVRRRNNDVIENYGENTRPTERTRTKHGQTEHRPADVEVPRRGSSTKAKERSRSQSRTGRSRSQQRQQSQNSRQESATRSHSRSSGSTEREDQDENRHDQ